MRTGMPSRWKASDHVASRRQVVGVVVEVADEDDRRACSAAANAIACASSIPAEIRVPALNVFAHGFGGKVGAKPACVCRGSVK